jgi:hypothetical protein
LRLWYDHPAKDWNGKCSFGEREIRRNAGRGIINENIMLNDITLGPEGPNMQINRTPGIFAGNTQIKSLSCKGI